MKIAIFLILLSVSSMSMGADKELKQCDINSKNEILSLLDAGKAEEFEGQYCEPTKAMEKVAWQQFTTSFCGSISRNQPPENYQDSLFSHYFAKIGKIEPGDKNKQNKERLTFLNQNKNNIVCSDQDCEIANNPVCKNGLQYMKYAQYRKTHKMFFYEFILKGLTPEDRSMWIDINAVTLDENGEFESVIDFMMKESKIAEEKGYDAYKEEVDQLITLFRKKPFNGRPFNELPQSEQDKYKQ